MRKFEALIDEYGLDDGGVASFTFKVQVLKKGKIYQEHQQHNGGDANNSIWEPSGYVIDDNSCWNQIGTESFNERFKEVDILKRVVRIEKN